jgi:hypothetical protein
MELTKSLKMIKYIILKVLYTNEKWYGHMNENEISWHQWNLFTLWLIWG